jgi:hypothetical protein
MKRFLIKKNMTGTWGLDNKSRLLITIDEITIFFRIELNKKINY